MLLRRCQFHPVITLITSISPSSCVKSVTKSSSHISLASSFKPISKSHQFCRSLVISASRVANTSEEETLCVSEWKGLKQEIDAIGIDYGVYTPYTCLMCPKCKGGKAMIRSLSFHVNENVDIAMWRCFIIECGWAGQVLADIRPTNYDANNISKVKVDLPRQFTEKNLRLEPPGEEIAIAFTYRLDGLIVNCKYRSINKKRFWQEKGAERILYGLDDIHDSDEIIIVEGEIDKLSMDEAGMFNSVSVPEGAPQKVSKRTLPSTELASRIILATDADKPGQALAEELARRLGRERCWRVTWPKKDELGTFKDANDVLKNLGVGALRDIIENAKPYE